MNARAALAAAATAALLIGGCASSATDTDRPGDGAAETAPGAEAGPELARFYDQRPDWQRCGGLPETVGGLAVQCATATVPLDYRAPDADTAELALLRLHHDGGDRPAVLINPGGPGVPGVDWLGAQLSGVAAGPLADRFDLVTFDPRGTGRSTPAVACRDDAAMDDYRLLDQGDVTPDGIARTEAVLADLAQACADGTGTEVLAHVGTRDTAADLDVLRVITDPGGDGLLRYVGLSYGTRLGTEYAARYGDRIGAMVLDGAVLPGDNGTDQALTQAAGFTAAFDAFAADCTRRADCPLPGADSADRSAAAVAALLAEIAADPLPAAGGRVLGPDDAQLAISQALYTPMLWAPLRRGLAEAHGGDGSALLELADMYYDRGPDGRYGTNLHDAFDAIRCVDAPAETDRDVLGAADAEVRARAPMFDDGRGAGRAPRDVCAFWPVPVTATATDEVEIDPQIGARILVVSSTEDPATPHADGIALAEALGADLLTVDAARHTAVLTDPCADEAAAAVLGGDRIAPDTVCRA